MPTLKVLWTPVSKPQFDDLQERAATAGKLDEFIRVHNEVVTNLQDLDQALEKGEMSYLTRQPGGVVRHWVHRFISVSYVVFRTEQVAWIMKYQSVPASWPD